MLKSQRNICMCVCVNWLKQEEKELGFEPIEVFKRRKPKGIGKWGKMEGVFLEAIQWMWNKYISLGYFDNLEGDRNCIFYRFICLKTVKQIIKKMENYK